MYLFYRYLLTITIILTSTLSFSQKPATPATGSISGKLVDADNNPVSYASVALWHMDSSVVNGALSTDDGSFSISPTGTGNFLLVIQSIGVTTKYVSVQIPESAPDKNLGTVKVAEKANVLKDVNIVGEKPLMELTVDKKVFNVAQNTTTAGGSAADVLQNVPSVSVDADGNVSLRGKSDVTILIDGKPATMLGPDVASALQSLPAGSIEDVEVLTNPSAKYDASGSSGIINIVTKKDQSFGINGNVTLGAGTHDKYNGNLSLNAHKGKWNVFLNSSYRANTTWNTVTTTLYNKIQNSSGYYPNALTNENVPHTFDGNFNTIGATYEPNKYNSITLTENINVMQFSFTDNSTYNTYLNTTPVTNFSGMPGLYESRYSSQAGGPFSTSTALDYKHKFKKKKEEELDIDATFAYNTIWHAQQYTTTYDTFINNNFTPYGKNPVFQNAPGNGNNNSVNVWADYTDPLFTPNGKLGLGFKSQFYYFNSNNTPTVDSANGAKYTDTTLLSNYSYTQQIEAAYINWNDQIGRWGYQAGLRVEDNIYSGSGSVPNDTSFHNNYLDLFPSAFISYKISDDQSIFLNYSRRTNRPGFRQLLPYVDLSNPGTVSQGNPGLVPEFINNVEFSYSKTDKRGDNIILSAYYAYTQNLIQNVTIPLSPAKSIEFNQPTSDLYSQPINIASGTTYGAEGTAHLQLLKIWDATVNANFFQNQLVVGNNNPEYTQYLTNNSGFTWFAKINTNLKLPKNFSFQVNANYNSPQIITQGTLKQSWWMDMALRKSFLKNKATLIVNCSDVFKTRQFVTYYNLSNYNETINRVKETRVGNITFTYRFGKTDFGKNSKHGNDAEPPVPTDEDRTKNLKQGDDNGNDQGGGGTGTGGGQGTGKSGTAH